MEQKWLANGTAVLVLDAGSGEPTVGDGNNGQKPNPDYRPALVAVLTTEYHEPGQVLDADPLAPEQAQAADLGPTAAGSGIPGQVATTPQSVPGPATTTVTTRDTAAEEPADAAAGALPGTAQIIAAIRGLETRADAGDADAQAQLDALNTAFEADYRTTAEPLEPAASDTTTTTTTTPAPPAGDAAA